MAGLLTVWASIAPETRMTFDNMKIALAAAGGTLDDVVKVTVYLADVNDRQKVNEVRKEYFKDNKPASTLIQISKFALDGMLIEIEAIAVTR
jgi:2-iminobutanoate/2-iminopropanoate deaminase